MTKKLVSIILCIALAISGCIGISSCSQDESYNESTAQQEFIDELVNSAIEEADIRIEDYFDVSYYVNLGEINSTTTTSHILTKSICSDDEIYIDAIQYDELTSSISEIFDELTDEEYEAIKTLAEEDSDIADMLYMVESDFEDYGYETETSDVSISAANIALTSATIATVGSILLSQGVNSAAVVAIKGAFNTMVATLKAFFLTNSAKAVIVTAAILVIATVVIINWNKIKPVFTQIVDVFVDNAKKLASTVTNVFNSIYNKAIESVVKEIEKNIDEILEGAEKLPDTKGKSKQYEKDGGFSQANDDYDSLKPENSHEIDTNYGKGRTGELSDGSKVNVRPGSTEGSPTLEIQLPNGNKIKIRYR